MPLSAGEGCDSHVSALNSELLAEKYTRPSPYKRQSTDFLWSNIHSLCFLSQTVLFFSLVSLSCIFLAAIRPWRPDSLNLLWTVDVEMCLLLEAWEEVIGALMWGAVAGGDFWGCNFNELSLYNRETSWSFFAGSVLISASFKSVFDVFFFNCAQYLKFSRLVLIS